MKKLVLSVILMLVAGASAVGLAKWQYDQAAIALRADPVRIKIERGANLRTLGGQLRGAGIDVRDWQLAMIGRLRTDASRIHAGTYAFASPLTLKRLVDQLVNGEVLRGEVRFVEGWTFAQMRAALAGNPDLAQDTVALDEAALLAAIGATESRAEGLFFPNTYYFDVGTSELELYRASYQKLRETLQIAWETRDKAVPLATPYEALILASIIEKETGMEADRTLIAGVFVNRLRLGMMLQSDPTTIYGMGNRFKGDLRRRDLVTDTPWNTYTRKGLPPTPIALPGAASIAAALHPATTSALYFVSRGDGASEFSDTLQQHEQAVRKFQLNRR